MGNAAAINYGPATGTSGARAGILDFRPEPRAEGPRRTRFAPVADVFDHCDAVTCELKRIERPAMRRDAERKMSRTAPTGRRAGQGPHDRSRLKAALMAVFGAPQAIPSHLCPVSDAGLRSAADTRMRGRHAI